jgi:hypothetical protein
VRSPTARTLARVAGACLALGLIVAPQAEAVRYASPTGKSTSDCQTAATACDLATAVHRVAGSEPAAGEEVVVEPGAYEVASEPIEPGAYGMTVHGVAGMPRPVITAHETEAFHGANALTLDYLDIEDQGDSEALGLSGATLERLLIRGRPNENVLCQCYDGSVRESAIVALPGGKGGAIGLHSNGGTSEEARWGDTIYSESATAAAIELNQLASSGALELSAYDTIAVNAAGGHDLLAGAHGTIELKDSDYASPAGAGTIADEGGHVTAPPLFANAPAGDFSELAGAPTIDAGLTSTEDGTLDFEGNARAAGAAPDIGAFEHQPPAAPSTAATGSASGTSQSGPGQSTPIGKALPPIPPQITLPTKTVTIDARTGVGTIAATCAAPGAQSCTLNGTILLARSLLEHKRRHRRPRGTVTIGAVSGQLTAGASGKLTVKLSRHALSELRHRQSPFAASLTAIAGDGAAQAPFHAALRLPLAAAGPHPRG